MQLNSWVEWASADQNCFVFTTLCFAALHQLIVLHVILKDSIELKVLVLINSNVKQAFDCGEDKERS